MVAATTLWTCWLSFAPAVLSSSGFLLRFFASYLAADVGPSSALSDVTRSGVGQGILLFVPGWQLISLEGRQRQQLTVSEGTAN